MQASLNENKALVQHFFATLTAGDYAAAFERVADDAVWWVAGSLPFSGDKTKAQYLAIVQRIREGFPDGFALEVQSMIGEGGVVAAEVVSRGVHRNGRAYNNRYHFLIEVAAGRIVRVKEYMDTLHLAQLLAP